MDKAYIDGISRSQMNANMLIKYMGEFEYLIEILKNGFLTPRYNREDFRFLDLKYYGIKIEKIHIPMVCFCDIPFSKISYHISEYGDYAIAFTKEWGLHNKIAPIHYFIKESSSSNELALLIKKANDKQDEDLYQYIFNYILYIKEIFGEQNNQNRLFIDEQEWRFIPSFDNVETDLLPFYIDGRDKLNYVDLSNSLSYNDSLRLKYEPKDIKYIMCKSEIEFSQLVDIIKSKKYSSEDEIRLISKIRLSSELEDM